MTKRTTRTRGKQTIRRYRSLNLGDATATAGPIELETRTPHREPNATSDVGVPLAQAAITALVGAILTGILAALAGRSDAFRVAMGVFAVTLAVSWLWRLGVSDRLLEIVERITQTDIDKNGDIGSVGETSHIMLENPGKAREESAKIGRENKGAIRTQELLSFVTRCATVGTSESKLGIKPSPSERAKYAELRDTLLDLGVAKWRDPERRKLGWELILTPEQAAPIISRHVRDMRNST